MDSTLSVIIRTAIMYVCVTIAMRFMGKRQLGELSAAEIVVALLISELATMPIGNHIVSGNKFHRNTCYS